LESLTARLEEGLRDAASAAGVAIALQRVGSMITPFFLSPSQAAAVSAAESTTALSGATEGGLPDETGSTGMETGGRIPIIRNYADALQCDTQAYARFFRAMLDRGVMLPPSQYEAWFLSIAHTEADIDETVEAARAAFAAARGLPVE
jgi:glutamate-1-semialdehyde 2,1-aminomutase